MRKIKIKLTDKNTIVMKYKSEIEYAIDKTLKDLDAQIHKKLLENMKKYDIDSVNVSGSINTKIINDTLFVSVDCEYAKFLEYGTGVVGAAHNHPDISNVDWLYGDGGWWYPTTTDKQQKYPNQPTTIIDGKLYAFTLGQSSKPFMYDTWIWAKSVVKNVLEKNLINAIN